MKLLDEVLIKRPETCDSCPFGSDDSDEGYMCCGMKRDTYAEKDGKGRMLFYAVQSPAEAVEHECECMFVEET